MLHRVSYQDIMKVKRKQKRSKRADISTPPGPLAESVVSAVESMGPGVPAESSGLLEELGSGILLHIKATDCGNPHTSHIISMMELFITERVK